MTYLPLLSVIRIALLATAAWLSTKALAGSFAGRILNEAVVVEGGGFTGFLATVLGLSSVFMVYLLGFLLTLVAISAVDRQLLGMGMWIVLFGLMHAPAVAAHSSIGWLRFLVGHPIMLEASALPLTVLWGVATIASLLTVLVIDGLTDDIQSFRAQRLSQQDRFQYERSIFVSSMSAIWGAVGLALAAVSAAVVFSAGFRHAPDILPWPVFVLGLGGVALVVLFAYGAVVHRMAHESAPSAASDSPEANSTV